ncbi:MAG: hypothetical protein H7257_04375 [Taibaiella sp.]|nr:hypothetical protein [Taibaiella sp.]
MRKFPTYLRIALFFLCFGSAGSSWAQTAAAYTYARTTGATFTSISGSGTTTSLGGNDDLIESSVGIGFTFYFAGTAYTTVSISTNGWASLANYTADALLDNTASIPGAGFLMLYWDDLTGTNAGNNVYYTTTGTSPNRVFTIEWSSWNTLNQPGNARKSNFQIKLYETSNVVQFCYGLFGTNTTTSTASIGIANSASDYKSLATVAATTASSSTFTTTLATWVANGSVFTFTPPCSGAPTCGTANATATTGCVPSYTSTLSLSGATTTNVAYQWQSSLTGATWTNVAGATNSTYAATVTAAIQYRCVLRCTYNASTGTSSARSLAVPGPVVSFTTNGHPLQI